MFILIIILFFTILEALHEGLFDQGKKTFSGVIEFIKLAGMPVMIILIYLDQSLDSYYFTDDMRQLWLYFMPKFIIGWLCIRYGIFDPLNNLAAGRGLYYIGNVKLYDRLLFWIVRKKFKTYPAVFFWITRLILTAIGVSLILRI